MDKRYVNGLNIVGTSKVWCKDGKLHCDEINPLTGELYPAIESEIGYKAWYKNNELHCETGPAVIRSNGLKYWFLHGVELTEEEFKSYQEKTQLEASMNAEKESITPPKIKI